MTEIALWIHPHLALELFPVWSLHSAKSLAPAHSATANFSHLFDGPC